MKRFDKGYIYASLLSDFFSSLVILFVFLKDFFLEENANPEDIKAALPVFVIAFIGIYAFFAVYRVLYYKTAGYELTETEIKCVRGVIFKKSSVLNYKKIHAINKKQTLFYRIFGVAVLTVDSGSTNTSHQAEITIIEKEKTVDALMREVNARKENGVSGTWDTEEKEEVLLSEEDSLYRFTSKKKMLYAAINIASTAFFTALFGVLAIIVLAVCKLVMHIASLGTWGQFFLYACGITVGAMLLLSAIALLGSLINSFVGYHNFTITKCGSNIQISYGLLEKHTNTFSYDRIKAVKISQSLTQRVLGFAAIKLEVIGYTNESGQDNVELGVLVPFCKYSEVGEILGRVLPDYIPEEKQTKAAAYFPFVSWFLLIFGIVANGTLLLTVGVLAILRVPTLAIGGTALAILGAEIVMLLIKCAEAALSFQNNGLAVHQGKITAYSGGFARNIIVFMAKNLVAVEDVTTPLRKKRGITSLVMHLRTNALSNEVKVHIQKAELTEELEKLLRL